MVLEGTSWVDQLIVIGPDKTSRLCVLCPEDNNTLYCGSNTSRLELHMLSFHKAIASTMMTEHRQEVLLRSYLSHVSRRIAALKKNRGAANLPQTNLKEATDPKVEKNNNLKETTVPKVEKNNNVLQPLVFDNISKK